MGIKKKISLDDIFNDDDFGLLDAKHKTSNIKTADQRLIDSFEELNDFVDKNGREPSTSSMSEYSLLARLKNIRENEQQKIALKLFDRHNLLGEVEMPNIAIEDILDDDEFGLLNTESDLSIFKYKHIPKEGDRAESDFVAQRKSLSEEEFKPYEKLFQKVHKEIKSGKRKLLPFNNIEKNLQVGNYYFIDGIMLLLKDADLKKTVWENKSGSRERIEGRTLTIFENGTYSNMLYRSLGKQIQKSGKLVTNTYEDTANKHFVNAGMIGEADIPTGWIYILKTKSKDPQITSVKNLYKIGFSKTPLERRIRNASREATYLFSDVIKVESFAIYNRNADVLEKLLHRFFASACLNIDIYNPQGNRASPREWFVVPLAIIVGAINLVLNEEISNYKYDLERECIVRKL